MPFLISKEFYSKVERLVKILDENFDEESTSTLKAEALKRRAEFLVNELEIIKSQEARIQGELQSLQNELSQLQDEESIEQ